MIITSFKTLILLAVFVAIVWYSSDFISSKDNSTSSSSSSSQNKITCKPNEVFINGACTSLGPCGLKPTANINCSTSDLICDTLNGNVWRCPLPCETVSNPLPIALGSCSYDNIKCDRDGRYYCPNDTELCNGHGSFYGQNYDCKCNTDYYGDGTHYGQCTNKCPDGTYLYNYTCSTILPCVNGTFSKELNQCICNQGYYNKNNICKLILNCSNNGTFNLQTEKCDCPAQYGGTYCQIGCDLNKYYFNGTCTNMLQCLNGGTFNITTNKCDCTGNYTGLLCDLNRSLNCSGHGDVILTNLGTFQNCKCDPGYYGPQCKDTRETMCNGRGIPQYDANGNFTGCICNNPNDGGKNCQFQSSEYCHGYGQVLTTANDMFDKCACDDTLSSGPYCCLNSSKITVSNSCIEKEPICTKNGLNDGWVRSYKSSDEIIQTPEWPNGGVCAANYCNNIDLNQRTVLLSINNQNADGSYNISCARLCPKTFNCSNCSSKPDFITNDTKVCMCDGGADSNYEPVCRQVQSDPQCGNSQLPGNLCTDGTKPVGLHCNNGSCLYHCGGFLPGPDYSQAYKDSFKKCIEGIDDIYYQRDKGYWAKNTEEKGSNPMPIYPTIDNERCISGNTATKTINDIDPQHASYWSLYGNPPSNVMKDGNLLSRNNLNPNKYMLYNSTRDNIGLIRNSNIKLEEKDQYNNGCIYTSPSDFNTEYCNGKGTFKQTCYKQDGTTVVNCSDASAYYKLKEGTCNCNRYMSESPSATPINTTIYGTWTSNNYMTTYNATLIINSDNTVSLTNNGVTSYGTVDNNVIVYTSGAYQMELTTPPSASNPNQLIITFRMRGRPVSSWTRKIDPPPPIGMSIYKGNSCQYNDNDTCNKKGVVDDNGKCNCSVGYAGSNCQYSSQTCNNRGSSQNDGSCICNTPYLSLYSGTYKNYTGSNCQYDDNSSCNGQGIVDNNGNCKWDPSKVFPRCVELVDPNEANYNNLQCKKTVNSDLFTTNCVKKGLTNNPPQEYGCPINKKSTVWSQYTGYKCHTKDADGGSCWNGGYPIRITSDTAQGTCQKNGEGYLFDACRIDDISNIGSLQNIDFSGITNKTVTGVGAVACSNRSNPTTILLANNGDNPYFSYLSSGTSDVCWGNPSQYINYVSNTDWFNLPIGQGGIQQRI